MFKYILEDISRNTRIPQKDVEYILKSYVSTCVQTLNKYPNKAIPFLDLMLLYHEHPQGLEDCIPWGFIQRECCEGYSVNMDELNTVVKEYRSLLLKSLGEGESCLIPKIGRFTFLDGKLRYWTSNSRDFKGRIFNSFRNELNKFVKESERCKERLTELVA